MLKFALAIIISKKFDFKPKFNKKKKKKEEGHFIFINVKICQNEFPILNIYTPNAMSSTLIKETLVKLKNTHE